MRALQEILSLAHPLQIAGDPGVVIEALVTDSRKTFPGVAFIALRGSSLDGHQFIDAAISEGADVIICDTLPDFLRERVTYVRVKNTHKAAGQLAAAFYDHPSAKLKVVGITGTNGKTTTTTILYRLFCALGYTCGLISTVQNIIGTEAISTEFTTPDAIPLQELFARMRDAGCSHVFMEVSSHGIHERRIEGIDFACGVFTNLTHDHLDYHGTMDEYVRVKKKFFDHLPESAFAITNLDDERGACMLQDTVAKKASYSLHAPAAFRGKVLENKLDGLMIDIDGHELHARLVGIFNAYNLLAVYGVAVLLGEDPAKVLAALSEQVAPSGRLECVVSPKEKILGIVDYAHTPDALKNILETITELRTQGQNVISVVGCGGDRDKSKRPLMGKIAVLHSDTAIFTSDNPRSEDPDVIIKDMETELNAAQREKVLRMANRREAIEAACTLAKPGDIVLVAGKGHETYQEIKGVRYDFNDRNVLMEIYDLLGI